MAAAYEFITIDQALAFPPVCRSFMYDQVKDLTSEEVLVLLLDTKQQILSQGYVYQHAWNDDVRVTLIEAQWTAMCLLGFVQVLIIK